MSPGEPQVDADVAAIDPPECYERIGIDRLEPLDTFRRIEALDADRKVLGILGKYRRFTAGREK